MKPETEIRNLKRALRETHVEKLEALQELAEYRGRATKAESRAADWERRFDELLSRCHLVKPE